MFPDFTAGALFGERLPAQAKKPVRAPSFLVPFALHRGQDLSRPYIFSIMKEALKQLTERCYPQRG